MNRKSLLGLILAVFTVGAAATSSVTGEWQVTLLRGTTSSPPLSTGATQEEAWAKCLARIPVPAPTTNQTSGANSYTCQTPRYVAKQVFSPNPITPAPDPGTATLSWSPPMTNTNGTNASLTGYRIVYGLKPTELVYSLQVDKPGAVGYLMDGLAPGTWYFAVIALSAGAESVPSNIASRVVQ